MANVGTVSLKRRAATTAIVGVLSAGTVMVSFQPRKLFLALTDRRLLFFGADSRGRPEQKPAISLPRQPLRTADIRKGLLTATFELYVEGEDKGLKIVFPFVTRTDALLISAALNGAAPASP
jgi:hypothetical protein